MTNIAAGCISFFSTEDAELAKSEALDHNAKVADFNAAAVHEQGIAAGEQLGRDIRKTQGTMATAYGGSGVDGSQGSATEVMADSIRRGVLDQASSKYNFDVKELDFKNEATGLRLDARNTRHAAIVKATSAGLSSFMGGNGGTGGLGESGSTTGDNNGGSSMWQGGNSLTGGTYTGSGSTSTSWGGQGSGWGTSSSTSGGWGS